MQEAENIEVDSSAVAHQEEELDVRPGSSSRRAAAVEAAYILEAVRK